jgi:hypothetical protein
MDEDFVEEEFGTPVMYAVCRTSAERVGYAIRTQVDGRDWINRNDTRLGLTPLMAVCRRPDNDEAVMIARVLLENGADANMRDSGPGSFPLFQASQEGKTALVQLFLQSGADVTMSPKRNPTTTALWIASQNGHTACAVEILKAAEQKGVLKRLLEQTNLVGTTPCCVGVERGHAQVVGALAKAGCDIRQASPVYYCTETNHNFDPVPAPPGMMLSVQYPLDMAVRSHATLSCAHCGANTPEIKQCGKCKLAYFCNRKCQTKHWPLHKRCCSELATGRDMYGDPAGPFPEPLSEPYGFQDPFFGCDFEYSGHPDKYKRNEHPVWEFDAGPRGRPDWQRYPDEIEASLEFLCKLGGPKYMYKPGDADAEGMYETTRTKHPPVHVATRHVSFDGLVTEREVYTGASRSVRRNGKRTLRDYRLSTPAPRA